MKINNRTLHERTVEMIAKDLKSPRKSSAEQKEYMKKVFENAKRIKKQ